MPARTMDHVASPYAICITERWLLHLIRTRATLSGAKTLAREAGIDLRTLYRVLDGRASPGGRLAACFGYTRVIRYTDRHRIIQPIDVVRDAIRALVRTHGVTTIARRAGISRPQVYRALAGRQIGILGEMAGFTRSIWYEPIRPPATPPSE